jgi:ribosomal protein S4E
MSKRKIDIVEISSEENPVKVTKMEQELKYKGESFFLNQLNGQYPNLKTVDIKYVIDIVTIMF